MSRLPKSKETRIAEGLSSLVAYHFPLPRDHKDRKKILNDGDPNQDGQDRLDREKYNSMLELTENIIDG